MYLGRPVPVDENSKGTDVGSEVSLPQGGRLEVHASIRGLGEV